MPPGLPGGSEHHVLPTGSTQNTFATTCWRDCKKKKASLGLNCTTQCPVTGSLFSMGGVCAWAAGGQDMLTEATPSGALSCVHLPRPRLGFLLLP